MKNLLKITQKEIIENLVKSSTGFIDLESLGADTQHEFYQLADLGIQIGDEIYACKLQSFDESAYKHQIIRCSINFCFGFSKDSKHWVRIEKPGPEYQYRADGWEGL